MFWLASYHPLIGTDPALPVITPSAACSLRNLRCVLWAAVVWSEHTCHVDSCFRSSLEQKQKHEHGRCDGLRDRRVSPAGRYLPTHLSCERDQHPQQPANETFQTLPLPLSFKWSMATTRANAHTPLQNEIDVYRIVALTLKMSVCVGGINTWLFLDSYPPFSPVTTTPRPFNLPISPSPRQKGTDKAPT